MVLDECGICNGPGIVEPFCDCDYNTLGCDDECGGEDYVDVCGVCNGPGILTQQGFCDCEENVMGCDGVCGGP